MGPGVGPGDGPGLGPGASWQVGGVPEQYADLQSHLWPHEHPSALGVVVQSWPAAAAATTQQKRRALVCEESRG